MKTIRKRTYNNCLYVFKIILAKGYDRDEAEKITIQIFDQYEFNPNGKSIMAMVDEIIHK